MRRARQTRRWLVMLGLTAMVGGIVAGVPSTAGAGGVRGFDGSTVKIAGYGLKSQLPGSEWGARARVKEFNDSNEIPGVKIQFTEYADDGQDPAVALGVVRRLVAQDEVFAIAPEVSLQTPGEYLTQQKVPVFGLGATAAYCTPKPSKAVWSFGFAGCQVTPEPTVTPDSHVLSLKYVQEQTGKKRPTVAYITQDDAVGHVAAELFELQFEEGNWKLVGSVENLPPPPVTDVSPFVQALLTMDNGKPPDFIRCGVSLDCLPIYTRLRAGGFTGPYEHNLYTDALVAPFKGSFVSIPHVNLAATGVPALDKMKTSVKAVKPDQQIDSGVMYGYMATDMFVSALKKAAAKGKSGITPENVQKAAAKQPWKIDGMAGPVEYPASTVASTPLCRELVVSDGTTWVTEEPFSCHNVRYKVK